MSKLVIGIELKKDTIFTEVNKQTSYEGAKADATLYDKVRAKSHDRAMLERWWSDACGLIVTMCVPYVINIEGFDVSSNDTIGISLSLPSNWNTKQWDVLKTTAQDIVCEYLLQQWHLLLNMEAQAKVSAEKITSATAKMAVALYDRVRPTRPTHNVVNMNQFGYIDGSA